MLDTSIACVRSEPTAFSEKERSPCVSTVLSDEAVNETGEDSGKWSGIFSDTDSGGGPMETSPRCAPQEGGKYGNEWEVCEMAQSMEPELNPGEGEGQESPEADENVNRKVDMSLEDGVAMAVLLVVVGIRGFSCGSDMPIFILSEALLFRLIFILVVKNSTTEDDLLILTTPFFLSFVVIVSLLDIRR